MPIILLALVLNIGSLTGGLAQARGVMRVIGLLGALLLTSLANANAQEQAEIRVQPRRGFCYTSASPNCAWTLLTEASVGALLVAPGSGADLPDVRGGALVGLLHNFGPRSAVGGGVEVGFWGLNGSWFVAAQPRYRHWLSPRSFLDGSVAWRTTFSEGQFSGQSIAARVDFTYDWIGVWAEGAYWLGDSSFGTSGGELVVGVRAGGLVGAILPAVGGIVAIIAAAATLGGS